jgi:hypothetical protein
MAEAKWAEFADKADGKEMSNKGMTRWCTDAKILTKKSCSSNNLDIAFSKVKPKGKPNITKAELNALIAEIAKAYQADHKCGSVDEAIKQINDKLAATSKQGHGTTGTSKTGGVEKMTDTSKYTGSHKERFDETGKGKGAEGRADKVDNTGYVGNYKGDGTYDKKH